MEDEEGNEYAFNAILRDIKGLDNRINENPDNYNDYFPHDHPVEFVVDSRPEEWRYQENDPILIDGLVAGNPSLNAIAERSSGKDLSASVIQITEIELYNRPAFIAYDIDKGSWNYVESGEEIAPPSKNTSGVFKLCGTQFVGGVRSIR